MPASEETYRGQSTLHVVFALVIAAYLGWTIQILWR